MAEEKVSPNVYPYSAAGNVLSVIRRYRDAGAPKTAINGTEMTRVGISEGNASRTLAALKFLGLLEDDKLTKKFEELNAAKTEEYPKVLGGILGHSYADIFAILPAKPTDIQIADAFRGKEPSKQRNRMKQLFVGLCQEAGIMEGKPTVVKGRKYTTNTPPAGNGTTHRKTPLLAPLDTPQLPKSASYWADRFAPYLDDLPLIERTWTQKKRDKWIGAVTAMLDYLIDVDDDRG